MLTGKLPFQSTDALELVHNHIAVIPKTPSVIDSMIPEMISIIIMKLIRKNPEDRYKNINAIIEDLENCLNQLNQTGKIDTFTLSNKDIYNRFLIEEKLYGREDEVKMLMNIYNNVTEGNVALILVSGDPGIGKSALIKEIHKPITEKHGYFISGKFEQFKRNTPYAALVQAFSELVKQLLMEDEETISYFRNKILENVRENGGVIVNVIPNLAAIIGKQPPLPDLSPTEKENQFSYVFQNFIRAITSLEHPLVIFLDDLQWADSSSLKIIETLLTSPGCGVY